MKEQMQAPTQAPAPAPEAAAPAPVVAQAAGNAFEAARAPVPQVVPLPPPRPKDLGTSPRDKFDNQFAAQGNRTIDPNEARWRQLSPDEAAPYLATPDEFRSQPGELGYHTTLGGQTWLWGKHAQDPKNPLRARDMMGPNAKQVFSRAIPTANPKDPKKQDVTVLNANGTTSVLGANKHGMTELPTTGYGFTTHHRNDVKVKGHAQPDQWGTAAGVARTMNMMADYRTMFPGSSIAIGDLSTDTGNSPLVQTGSNKRHSTHYQGSQVDMQYPQGKGSTNAGPKTADDLFRTRSLVRIAEQNGMNRFYTDPALHQKGLYTAPGTSEKGESHHRDHIHIGQGSGRRAAPAPAPAPRARASRIRRRR